jgi:putative transposase
MHLVFVTKYRRQVFTDQMLTFCEHTMRAVCAELDVELAEFNREADHVHLLAEWRGLRRRSSVRHLRAGR